MNDPQEIRDYVDRMATADPYGAVDGGRLLARGRRGRQRRRMLAGGGAAAGVTAVVAVTATLLSGAGTVPAPGEEASVAGAATSTPSTWPGGARTATSAGPTGSSREVVSEAEALRRCRGQWSRDTGRQIQAVQLLSSQPISDPGPRTYRVHTSMVIDYDDKPGAYDCSIPAKGENRPGRILDGKQPTADPAMFADPSADNATVLRACSAALKFLATAPDSQLPYPRPTRPMATDLSGWRIVTRSALPKVGTVFVALSPKADRVAFCEIYPAGSPAENAMRSEVRLTSPDGKRTPYAKPHLSEHLLESGSQCDSRCSGWLHRESGRLPAEVVRLHVASPSGKSVDVAVKNGYWALIWANGDPQRRPDVTVTAYDAEGKVVRPDAN